MGGADLHRLAGGGDGEPAGTAGDRRPGAFGGAVPVAGGLDDRAEAGLAVELTAKAGAVALHRTEVDPGHRPLGHLLGVGDQRGEHIGPGDEPGQVAVAVDDGQVVVVLVGDQAADLLGVIVDMGGERIRRHQL